MASNLLAMASNPIAMASNLMQCSNKVHWTCDSERLQSTSDPMASNLLVSPTTAMASNLYYK